jgi:hypothetical protein
VSRLWDSLKEVERYEAEVTDRSAQADSDLVAERRCSERLWLYSPLLVYGHTTENEPFHEGTEGLHVNAGGGLITLTTSVTNGQRLLLINKLNQQEQESRVVCERSKHLTRAAVAVKFLRPVDHFWTAGVYDALTAAQTKTTVCPSHSVEELPLLGKIRNGLAIPALFFRLKR